MLHYLNQLVPKFEFPAIWWQAMYHRNVYQNCCAWKWWYGSSEPSQNSCKSWNQNDKLKDSIPGKSRWTAESGADHLWLCFYGAVVKYWKLSKRIVILPKYNSVTSKTPGIEIILKLRYKVFHSYNTNSSLPTPVLWSVWKYKILLYIDR